MTFTKKLKFEKDEVVRPPVCRLCFDVKILPVSSSVLPYLGVAEKHSLFHAQSAILHL